MEIRTFTGGRFGENTYLIVGDDRRSAVVVDPGDAAAEVARKISAEALELQAILLTHAHLDHIEGVSDIRAITPEVPIWLHPDDRELYDALPQQAAMFGLTVDPQPAPTDELVHGQRFECDACSFDVRFTPGHAPGHVIFVSTDENVAISGDVVFAGSIGRTDLPGGHLQTLMASIRDQVLTLPDDMILLSGHGPATTVGQERLTNPFLVPHYGGELV